MIDESKWIDYSHGMELHLDEEPNSRQNENGILFLSEYYMNKYLNGKMTAEDVSTFETITKSLQSYDEDGNQVKGLYDRGAGESLNKSKEELRTISHDNLTAIAAFSYKHNLEFHKDIYEHGISHWWRFDNVPGSNRIARTMLPRDIIYWGRLNKKCWGYILLWWLCLEQIFSCWKKYKVRPTMKERLKNGWFFGKKLKEEKVGNDIHITYRKRFSKEEYTIRHILHTDGKLLTFLRVYSLAKDSWTMRMCGRICGWILKKRFGKDYFHKIFTIYFRDLNHPNNISSKNLIDEWRK